LEDWEIMDVKIMNSAAPRTILLAEDNEDDVFFMKRALKGAGIADSLQVVSSGQEAIEYLAGTGKFADRKDYPMPVLVLLDLKLPLMSGLEVLKWIRQQTVLNNIVVVVLTSSKEGKDIDQAYQIGANSYLVKPPAMTDLQELVKAFNLYWLQRNEFPAREH
jgi:CheY-like chemotaxis protein